MSGSWEQVHRRYELAEEVLRRLRRARRVEDVVERWLPHIDREFGDLGTFLQHVQRQWYSRLAVRVDMMLDPAGTDGDPRSMWNSLCDDEPGMRRLLDTYAAHPALRHGDLLNSDLLRRATGFSVDELASRPAPAPRSRLRDRLPCYRMAAALHRGVVVRM